MTDEATPQPPPAAAPPPTPAAPAPASDAGHAGLGLFLALVMLVLQVPLGFLAIPLARLFGAGSEASYAVFVPALFFGVSQLLYIVPTAIWLQTSGKTRTALGMWIGAGVLFLLNAACFGLLAVGW